MRSVFQKHAQVLQGVLFFSFLLLAVVVFLRGSILNRAEKYPVTVLDDGWRIEKNGVLLDASALSKVHTGEIRRGDVFVLRRTLPAETDLPSGCLFFRNLHTATRILLDGEEVYASGVEAYEAGKMVGRLVCYASLPVDYPGKELTIEVTAAENNAFYGLGPFSLGTEQDLFIRFFKDRQLAFYIGVFLAIFAVFQLCWIPLLLQNDRSNLKLLFSALTTLVLAAYLLGYYNLFDLITDIPTVREAMRVFI